MAQQQQPNALDIIELDIEGLYEDTFFEAFQFGGYDEIQMHAEVALIRDRRKRCSLSRKDFQ